MTVVFHTPAILLPAVSMAGTPSRALNGGIAQRPQSAAAALSAATDSFQATGLYAPESINRIQAEAYKERGNDYFLLRHYDLAISEYLKALYADPGYTDPYYNLGKIYTLTGDPRRAIEVYDRLLQLTPDDHEVRTLLSTQLVKQGQYDAASQQYGYILQRDPGFDPARRNLGLLQTQLQATTDPQGAQAVLTQAAQTTLKQAKALAKNYYRSQRGGLPYAQLVDRLSYQFSATQSRTQGENMAEYDHQDQGPGLIRLRPELAFAAPVVTAAYLVHELVHALDGDAISSIMEEQDAYRHQARFWNLNKGDVRDPNLDLAGGLLNQSVDLLDQEVRRSYSDDDLLPEKSPGHGLPRNAEALLAYNRAKLDRLRSYQVERIKSLLPG